MIRAEIKLRNGKLHDFYLPQNWDEVATDKLLQIAPILLVDSANNRIEIVKAYAAKSKDILGAFLSLSVEDVYRLTIAIAWMYDTWFCKPYFDFFKNDKRDKYYLPADSLANCTVIEYIFADKYFEAIRNGDSTKLNYLLATLCRPRRKNYNPDAVDADGDIREKFNSVLIEKRAALMGKVDMRFKLFFLLFFIGCKKELAKKFSPIFTAASENTDVPTSPDFGLIGVVWDLAGGLGDAEKIQTEYLQTVFAYLCKKHYDNLALQKQHDKSSHI